MALWLKEGGPQSDVVVSTRVRLARNLAGLPFPHRIMGTERVREVKEPVKECFLKNGMDFSLTEMKNLSPLERTRLVEQHLISRDLAKSPDGAVLLSPDQTVGIMMMEEDHYRLQCIKSGFQVDAALKGCQELERMLGEKAHYAFDEELGYLTACPTNLGTGLRIGVMMHLKGLAVTGALSGILSSLGQFGVTARGLYGEGTESKADLYQISNQTTLGISEEDIAKNLSAVVREILKKEREAREMLMRENELWLKDSVMRSYGLLKYAAKMLSLIHIFLTIHKRVVKTAHMARCHPGFRIHENGAIQPYIIAAFGDKFAPPGLLDIIFKFHTQRAIIPGVGKTAVDFRTGENKPSVFCQRDDLFHGLLASLHLKPPEYEFLPAK